ncbi:hypothetical protein NM22_14375 [Vibrio tubiashii]|nr:hypothetical protein NM22_14375 [Vibrio tubiashii]
MYKQSEVNTALISILLILSAIIVFTSSYIGGALIALSINLVIGTLFYSMTIEVTGNKVSWYFGLGFLRKEVDASSITEISIYETKWYQGTGVRILKDGWMYNASVGKALKLSMSSGKNIYLGCKDVEGLQFALESSN